MFKMTRHIATTAIALACASAATLAQAAPKVWITVGDAAYELLRQASTQPLNSETRALTVAAPDNRRQVENVHVVEVDSALLPQLSEAVHEQLRHCGGYVVHDSLADAHAALVFLGRQLDAAPALAPSYAIDNQATVNDLLPMIEEGKVRATIEKLSAYRNRYYESATGVASSNWLAKNWQLLARNRADASVRQVSHSWAQKSVVLTIRGTTNPDEIVVIGGHLDSIAGGQTSPAPGADDDASGVASLTEVARTLLQSGYRPARTIEFMAYAAEEVGLRGSAAIANDYSTQGRKVVGVLQLDMTNYKGSAGDIYLITDFTNAAQNTFIANLASAYLPTLTVGQSFCGYACSDHGSWTARGYAASFPFESSFNQSNPNIHSRNDTIDKSGNVATHAMKFSQLALTFAVELGSDGPAP